MARIKVKKSKISRKSSPSANRAFEKMMVGTKLTKKEARSILYSIKRNRK